MSRRGECPASGGDDGVIRAITAVKWTTATTPTPPQLLNLIDLVPDARPCGLCSQSHRPRLRLSSPVSQPYSSQLLPASFLQHMLAHSRQPMTG